jgi:hypothetical protein
MRGEVVSRGMFAALCSGPAAMADGRDGAAGAGCYGLMRATLLDVLAIQARQRMAGT